MRFCLAVGGDNDDSDDIDTDSVGDFYYDGGLSVDQRHLRRCKRQTEKDQEGERRRHLVGKERTMPLLSSLPTPVLAIAPDAVRHLEGGDALSALWVLTVFTKCSETIQEGRRLENVSWRLWHRQLHAAASIASGAKGAYVTADDKFAEEKDVIWDEKVGLLDVVQEADVADTRALEDTTARSKTGLESTLVAERQQRGYPSAQVDTTVQLSHDQGVATTTFTASSTTTFSSTETGKKSASTITAIATTTTTSTTTPPRIVSSSSAPSPTSLVPRPALRHTASNPYGGQRRKSFLAVVGPGGRMNVGQIICDLISTSPSSSSLDSTYTLTVPCQPEGDFGAFESITRRTSMKMKRWHSESTIVGDEQQESHKVYSDEALVGGPRTSRVPLSGSPPAELVSGRALAASSTPTTPTKRHAPSTMLSIPPAATGSGSSLPSGVGSLSAEQQGHHQGSHHHHCVSQLPTPGAETDDAGNGRGVDGMFGLERLTAEQGSSATTTTTTTTLCGMEAKPHISVDDLSVPRTPPETVVVGRGTAASPGTPRGPVPPKLVIVNPTPGPTPQPTPPSTPLLEGGPVPPSSNGKKHGAFLGVPSGSRRGMKRSAAQAKVTKEVPKKVVVEAEDTTEEWEEDEPEEQTKPRAVSPPKLSVDATTTQTLTTPNPDRLSPSESTRSDDSGLGSSIVSLPLDERQNPQPIPEPPSPTPSQQDDQPRAGTSVTSVTSVKSTRSTKSLGATAAAAGPNLSMTRRASTGVVAGRSKAKGSTKARVALGSRSKSAASIGGSRSRSRGREDTVVGLAAAAVGVMTATLSTSPGTMGQEQGIMEKKRRASSGDAKSRRRVSGLAALTRTLSHEDVLEVTEDDDDGDATDGFEDASTDEDETQHQALLAAQLRQQQEEDRVKREQLLLRARQLEEQERRRVEYERQVAEVQAEKETEEGLRNMMIIQQQQQHLMQQQQRQDLWQRQQYEAQLALERQRERKEMEERIRVQQAALRAAEIEAHAQAQAEARAAALAQQQSEAEERTRERLRANAGMGVVQSKGAVARTKATKFEFGSNSDDGSVSVVSADVGVKGSDGSSERGSVKGKEREVIPERQASLQQVRQPSLQQVEQPPPSQKPIDSKAARKSVPADKDQLAAALQLVAVAEQEAGSSSKGKNKSKDGASGSKSQSKDKGKGKGRDKSTTSSSSGAAGVMTTSLASPLLPSNTNGRKIILSTSDSDDYTDTEDDEGDSWTSEEDEGDEDEEPLKSNSVRSQPPPQPTPQPQQTSHARRPSYPEMGNARAGPGPAPRPGLLRTQSTTSGQPRFMTKREQVFHARRQVELAAIQLRREEEEKQRHKEMFAKKPTSSFQNVAKLAMTSGDGTSAPSDKQEGGGEAAMPPRTKSALSLLLNPDPLMFPENHPYRRGHSSGELVRPMMGFGAMGAFGPMTNIHPHQHQQQRSQAVPLAGGHDARMDQARVPQRRPAGLDRQMSERFLAHDAQEAEKRKQAEAAARAEEERVRMLHEQKVEEEERTRRARIQQVEEEERAKQKQLQQALYERAQRQQQQRERQPQRRATDPPAPPAAAPQPQAQPPHQHRRQASQQSKTSRPPSMHQLGGVGSLMPSAFRGVGMQVNKGSAAVPVASQVDIGPIATLERPPPAAPAAPPPTKNSLSGTRLRGPPQGQELETDSEDEGENKENDNALNMAKSIAEQKLRMFAERRGIVPAPPSPLAPRPGPSRAAPQQLPMEDTPPWARQPYQAQVYEDHHSGYRGPPVVPQPIPLVHPYNLPVAAIPTTPRTTRKLMLRTELSESVRRGLLWERQQGVKPIKRTASASNAEGASRFPPIPQLAASPSMVQLRPKVRRLEGVDEGAVLGHVEPAKKATREELEERRKRVLARNRSEANNFHTSGW